MKIIQAEATEIGYRPPIQTWTMDFVPKGYVSLDDGVDTRIYYNAMGFVELILENGIVTGMTANEAAYQAYLAALPPEEVSDPVGQRERAYEEERLVEWPEGGGTYLTVTEAAQQWQYYAAEGNTANTVRLQELIAAAKAVIRERYPDAPADVG